MDEEALEGWARTNRQLGYAIGTLKMIVNEIGEAENARMEKIARMAKQAIEYDGSVA